MRTLIGVLFSLLVLAAGADSKAEPILKPADLPGFHLHGSWGGWNEISLEVETYWTLPNKRFMDYSETWMTVTESAWDNANNKRKVSQQNVNVDRWEWRTVEEAKAFAETVYNLDGTRKSFHGAGQAHVAGPKSLWVAGAPSGKMIGDRSWYQVYPTPGNKVEELESNQHALTLVVLAGKTVVTLRVGGRRDIPLDRAWVEELARKIAARVR